MEYPINWNSDREIKRLFAYQSRVGLAPKWGSVSIAHYQIMQCRAYDYIIKMGLITNNLTTVKVRRGRLEAGSIDLGPVQRIYEWIHDPAYHA